MNAGLTDKRWDEYDALIKTQVTDYAKRFKALENKVDWKIIRAMVLDGEWRFNLAAMEGSRYANRQFG